MYNLSMINKEEIIEERDKYIFNHIALAAKIANKLHIEDNGYFDKEDLIQISIMGLIKAVDKYDSETGNQISTLAYPVCRGEILRFMRDSNIVKLPRNIAEISSKVYKYINQGLTDEQIKEEMGSEYNTYLLSKELKKTGSLDVTIKEDSYNSSTLHEFVSNGEILEEELCLSMQLKHAFETLTEKEKKVIILSFFKEKTQTEIGEILGCSQMTVCRLIKKALAKLKKNMEN